MPRPPRQMSQAELDDYLDELVRDGLDDTPEFHAAYAVWEEIDNGSGDHG